MNLSNEEFPHHQNGFVGEIKEDLLTVHDDPVSFEDDSLDSNRGIGPSHHILRRHICSVVGILKRNIPPDWTHMETSTSFHLCRLDLTAKDLPLVVNVFTVDMVTGVSSLTHMGREINLAAFESDIFDEESKFVSDVSESQIISFIEELNCLNGSVTSSHLRLLCSQLMERMLDNPLLSKKSRDVVCFCKEQINFMTSNEDPQDDSVTMIFARALSVNTSQEGYDRIKSLNCIRLPTLHNSRRATKRRAARDFVKSQSSSANRKFSLPTVNVHPRNDPPTENNESCLTSDEVSENVQPVRRCRGWSPPTVVEKIKEYKEFVDNKRKRETGSSGSNVGSVRPTSESPKTNNFSDKRPRKRKRRQVLSTIPEQPLLVRKVLKLTPVAAPPPGILKLIPVKNISLPPGRIIASGKTRVLSKD